MEDQSIIALYLKRDENAIAETARKYGGYCGRIAGNILPTPQDTEECLNDTWLRAWNAIPPQQPTRFAVFLGSIVRHVAINLYNRMHAQKRFDRLEQMLSELSECVPAPDSVEQTAENSVLPLQINAWLSGLPQKDRRLFLRRYWYGESVQDLARLEGCSANALASRMKRLRQGLKQQLEREGINI